MSTGLFSGVYDVINNDSYWFPADHNGKQFGFKDLNTRPDANVFIPNFRDLHWSIVIGFILVICRYFLDKYVIIPLGYRIGVSKKKVVYLEANPALEAVYKKGGKKDEATYLRLSKQLDMSVRQIETWFRKRKQKDTPPSIIKFCNNGWHLIFYSIAFTYGITVLWDKPWLWRTRECWNGWPEQDVTSDLYWYYMTELAFYWSLVFTLFTDHKRKDFIEFIVHHFATIMLLYMSWAGNFIRIGSLILVLHDAADPWLAFAKVGIYIKCDKLTDVCFGIFVTVWFLSRLIYFPLWVINSTLFEVREFYSKVGLIIAIGNGFLFCLMVLHLMWTHSICRILYNSVWHGKRSDTRSDTEDDGLSDENDNLVPNGTLELKNGATKSSASQNGVNQNSSTKNGIKINGDLQNSRKMIQISQNGVKQNGVPQNDDVH